MSKSFIRAMKNYFILILGLLTTVVFGQQPQTSGRPNFKKIKLTGTVIDQETQEALEYATISLVNKRFPDRIQGGITDSKGKFNLDVFPGKYNVTIEYIGFDKIQYDEKVLRADENLGTIALQIAA